MNAANPPRPSDTLRVVAVTAAAIFMAAAALVGSGLFGGTAVQDLQGGALDADGSYLAPARGAFRIWSVIYLGLAAYTIWQTLPSQRANRRQRALGWWIALTMVLNGVWLLTAQFLTLALTVVAIVLLLVALSVTFHRAVRVRHERWVDGLLIDGVTGLHLGWVTLATVANSAAWLTVSAPDEWEAAADAAGVAVLLVVAIIGVAIGWWSRGQGASAFAAFAPALALAWGLSWLAVARIGGSPPSDAIGITAVVVAVVVLVPPLIGQYHPRGRTTRADRDPHTPETAPFGALDAKEQK